MIRGKHVPCEINRVPGKYYNKNGDYYLIGCRTHGFKRQQVKKWFHLYRVSRHCYCGLPLHDRYVSYDKPISGMQGHWEYDVVWEKPVCGDKHYGICNTTSRWGGESSCGVHGISWQHCRNCLEWLPPDYDKRPLKKRQLDSALRRSIWWQRLVDRFKGRAPKGWHWNRPKWW